MKRQPGWGGGCSSTPPYLPPSFLGGGLSRGHESTIQAKGPPTSEHMVEMVQTFTAFPVGPATLATLPAERMRQQISPVLLGMHMACA
jgi:hypothetical protein